MESNTTTYDYEKSRKRIDEILDASDNSYEEVDRIPARDKLTYTNGFYVNCSALFVDIRDSSKLPDKYKRPTLSKIYRSYISEVVAVLNGNGDCREINIEGDSVWGVFDTPYKIDINWVFSTAAKVSSVVDTLNCKYKKKGIDPITIGIGIDYGRALMIKAGYDGSGINEVVWMGDVVNQAAKLCGFGNKTYHDNELMVSGVIYDNLNDHNKKLMTWNQTRSCWHGTIVNSEMDKWIQTNCK